MTKVESTILFLHDQINETREVLEFERESIDIESSEKHLDFCLDLLERLGE